LHLFIFGLQFLAESLDVIQDADWIMSLGNVFAKHYELYTSDDEHAAILHRYQFSYLKHALVDAKIMLNIFFCCMRS
jgi:hypothetical protein